jgi:sporulation protein YlmC with PRC-barrel domain
MKLGLGGTLLIRESVPQSMAPTNFKEMEMNYEERDTYGMYKGSDFSVHAGEQKHGPGPEVMGADTLIGNDVYNEKEEDLGDIKEIMIDMRTGTVAYAVLSFGGILGLGDKLFAVPWNALVLDTTNKRFVLNVDKERLETAPGFDKDAWPDMADETWMKEIHSFYGTKSYPGDLHS